MSAPEKLTREQWAQIEAKVSHPYGRAVLMVDGYRLTLSVGLRKKPLTFGLMIYINGEFRGRWTLEDCEERRRFLQPKKVYAFSAARRAAFTKKFGKRATAEHRLDASFTEYSPLWTSFGALRRHLIANNQHITLGPDDASA